MLLSLLQDLGTQEMPVVSLLCSKVPLFTSATCVLTGWQATSISLGSSDVGSPGGFLPAESDLYRRQQKVPPYHRPVFREFGLNNFKPTAKSKEQYDTHQHAIHQHFATHAFCVCVCTYVYFQLFGFFCFY